MHKQTAIIVLVIAFLLIGAVLLWPRNTQVPPMLNSNVQEVHLVDTPFGFVTGIQGDMLTVNTQFGVQTYRLKDSTVIHGSGLSKTRADLEVGALISITRAVNGVIEEVDIIPPPPSS